MSIAEVTTYTLMINGQPTSHISDKLQGMHRSIYHSIDGCLFDGTMVDPLGDKKLAEAVAKMNADAESYKQFVTTSEVVKKG